MCICQFDLVSSRASDDPSPTSRIGATLTRPPIDTAIIDSLCRLGLYESAILRCRSGIAASSTGSLIHAKWLSLLITTLAERDAEKAQSIKDALSEAQKLYDSYIADPKNQAYRVWVHYSYEAVRLNLISRSVANYLAAPTNKTRRDDALETIRNLLDHLVEIKEEAHAQLGAALRRDDRESAIRAHDLGSLHNRLSLLEIDCMLLRCDCYPTDSDERIAGGTEALAAIDKITGRIESDWSGQELLDLARSQSLIALNRYGDAVHSLTKWLATVDDPSLRNRGIALLAKSHQMQGDFNAAAKVLLNATGNALQESPEIALATLELQIASWKKQADKPAGPTTSADDNQREIERILKMKELVVDRFGNYWRQRAEALIVASSLGSSTPNNVSTSTTSLDLLKVNIRQRLAAGEYAAAIELLEQAEAASLAANETKQAFGFAKSAIGIMQQQSVGSDPTRLPVTQAVIDRIASTAKKYSVEETSPQLHQSAVELQKALIATESSSTASAAMNEAYQQMLLDHVTTWPDRQSSNGIRAQLQLLYLGTADVRSLVELWGEELAWLATSPSESDVKRTEQHDIRIATANAYLVNAALLSGLAQDTRAELQPVRPPTLDHLLVGSRWLVDALGADYDWWTIDGGIQPLDGKSIAWSLPTNTFENNASASAFHKILVASTQPELANIGTEVQQVIDWTQTDYPGRIAWIVALDSKLSSILRLRWISDGNQPSQDWLASVLLLHEASQAGLRALEASLHPSLLLKLKEHLAIAEARLVAVRGDAEMAIVELQKFREKDLRDPRWTMELARLFEIQDASSEKALQLYRQLAAGSPIGSDAWFESRLSSVRCLRSQKKQSEADQVVSLVQAMVADIPEKWKRRSK